MELKYIRILIFTSISEKTRHLCSDLHGKVPFCATYTIIASTFSEEVQHNQPLANEVSLNAIRVHGLLQALHTKVHVGLELHVKEIYRYTIPSFYIITVYLRYTRVQSEDDDGTINVLDITTKPTVSLTFGSLLK